MTLPDGKVLTKEREVGAAVLELLGVNMAQFTQIAMIAQGDFRKLILADTKERIGIFRHIFQTERYQQLQERIREEARQLGRQREDRRQRIDTLVKGLEREPAQAGGDSGAGEGTAAETGEETRSEECAADDSRLMERIQVLLDGDRRKQEELDGQLDRFTREGEELQRQLTEGEATEEILARKEASRKELDELAETIKTAETQLAQAQEKQPEAAALLEEAAAIEGRLAEYDEAEQLRAQRDQLSKDLAGQKETAGKAAARQEELQRTVDKERRALEELAAAGGQLERLRGELQAQTVKNQGLSALASSIDDAISSEKEWEKEKENYRHLADAAEAAERELQVLRRGFLDAQAGVLAAQLTPGEPCPVCGSTEHPRPAKLSDEVPDREGVDQAEASAKTAREKAEKKSRTCASLQAAQKTLRQEIGRRAGELLEDVPEGESLEAVKEKAQEAARLLRETQDRLKKQIQTEEDRLTEKDRLEKQLPLDKQALEEADRKQQEAGKTCASLEASLEEKEKTLQIRLAQLTHPSREAAEEAAAKLREKSRQLNEDLEKATREHSRCQQEKERLTERIRVAEEQLAGAKSADLAALRQKRDEVQRQEKDLRAQRQRIASRLHTNERNAARIGEELAAMEAEEESYTQIRGLAETLGGTLSGSDRIMLETFVQMQYFDRIVERANTRLLVMTGGRYRMKRRRTPAGRRGQSGLELNVIDYHNGTERDIRTLSGGESFQASLALALGLSDEVQSSAGGIRLDTLFVDEGFGSLDPETLEKAMDALRGLSENRRLVGVISHVEEMKSRIDRQIRVTKKADGTSEAKIV